MHLGRVRGYPAECLSGPGLTGTIGNIGRSWIPLRTAKVRLQVENPGLMRFGMFVTAAFHGKTRRSMPGAGRGDFASA